MEPIVKLLEEVEDEWMHSGADVDAFEAALNHDIGGTLSTSHTSVANSGNIHSPSPSFASWQNPLGSEISNRHRQHSLESTKLKEQHLSEHPLQHQPHNDAQDNRQQGHTWQNASQNTQTSGLQILDKKPLSNEPEQVHNQDSESQYAKLQKMSSQQASSMEQSGNSINRNPKSVLFAALLPTIVSQLDKDRAMQLHTLYTKLKNKEISKDGFMQHMKDIVGDQIVRLAVKKFQQPSSRAPLVATQAASKMKPSLQQPSLQHNQRQDNRQPSQIWENASQNTQTRGLSILEKKPFSYEPEQMNNLDSESQYAKLQKTSSQQVSSMEQSVNSINRNPKSVLFAALLPTVVSQLDKDRAMQLHTLYAKLKKNEISKDGFMKHMKDIVGDQMLRLAVSKLLQEEEQQLFSGPKEDRRVPYASRIVGQEEEERLILHKTPLQKELVTFTGKYAADICHPHNDAFVISFKVAGRNLRRVLIDTGSSVDILFKAAFDRMMLIDHPIEPSVTSLLGLTGHSKMSIGRVRLPVKLGTPPRCHVQSVDFILMDTPSSYNAILGRPTLNAVRTTVSTYDLTLKFPTSRGVGEIKGDKRASRMT